ncbi:DUF6074 family protein [Allorhizobium sp. BGMRC 0089]|uniref:DUF6074 family protein n=1 Tax=Allorhizobium sonneratiae TaxID=2934936 RepID=UPI002033C105|nr:DUF6074 family protein [Allorhizobium sonneratiae]MCM2294252.1 DUF6074 family protein [Allorhizobium sonneratiae]
MSKVAVQSQSAPSSIAIFPLASRRGLVRQSAIELDRLNGEDANIFWRKTCKALGAELLDLGCPAEQMREEILQFQNSVQMELMWMHHNKERRG